MTEKKRAAKFTLSFNPDNPHHVMAINTLNNLGRKKADFLAMLIEIAAKNPDVLYTLMMSILGKHGKTEERSASTSAERKPAKPPSVKQIAEPGTKSPVPKEMPDALKESYEPEIESWRTPGSSSTDGQKAPQENWEISLPPPVDGPEKEGAGEEEDLPEDFLEALYANVQMFDELGDADDDPF